MKTIIRWALGAFVIFYILKYPGRAAGTFEQILGLLSYSGTRLAMFLGAL